MTKIVNGVEVEMTPQEIAEFKDVEHKAVVISEFEIKMNALRNKRAGMLSACDWTQTSDCPLSATKVKAWATYRQKLRDMTKGLDEDTEFEKIEFPTKPK